MNTQIYSGDLKLFAEIKEPLSYTPTGQVDEWNLDFTIRAGINREAISQPDDSENTGNKKTLNLYARYDPRIKNDQSLFIANEEFKVSQLDNVGYQNKRVNFTVTQV